MFDSFARALVQPPTEQLSWARWEPTGRARGWTTGGRRV